MAYETCPNYCYARRGRACWPSTTALTSNRKFLPPQDPVYLQPMTYMMQYPGYSGDFITSVGDYANPEEIKAFFGKSFGPQYAEKRQAHADAPKNVKTKCTGCKGLG